MVHERLQGRASDSGEDWYGRFVESEEQPHPRKNGGRSHDVHDIFSGEKHLSVGVVPSVGLLVVVAFPMSFSGHNNGYVEKSPRRSLSRHFTRLRNGSLAKSVNPEYY